MPKTVIALTTPEDPADLLLEVLVLADVFEKDDPSDIGLTVVQALSPTWKQVSAALSTGPSEYTMYAYDRAVARTALHFMLRKILADMKIVLLECAAAIEVGAYLHEAKVEYDIV